jgi:hypothetical protein
MNLIVKGGWALAGLEAKEFSAIGLRYVWLSAAARQDVALHDVMQQSRQGSVQQDTSGYNKRDRGRRQGELELPAYNSGLGSSAPC